MTIRKGNNARIDETNDVRTAGNSLVEPTESDGFLNQYPSDQ